MQNINWKQKATALAATGVLSRRAIAETLDVPRSTCLDYLRSVDGDTKAVKEVDNSLNARILVISDMHVPYNVDGLIPFLKSMKEKYQPTRVVCIGDESDCHATSFHDSDPDLYSAGDELRETTKVFKQIEEIFPVMDLIDSNHSSMIYRKSKHHGIPRHYIKSYNDFLGVGDGWVWHNDLTLTLPDGSPVYFHHGKSADGLKLSQTTGMSTVQGHYHEKFNISYWANSLGLYFSMQVGCLIKDSSYAFAYNNVNLKRPIIGLGLIIDSKPVLEAFPL